MYVLRRILPAFFILAFLASACSRAQSVAPTAAATKALLATIKTTQQAAAAAATNAAKTPKPTQAPPTAVPPTFVAPTAPPADVQRVKIFLIAPSDNGRSGKLVGCGDSVIPVDVPIAPTVAVLRAALNQLLALKSQYYGESGLYNALYQSNLTVGDLNIVNGEAIIYLEGTFLQGGTCDSPRIQAQLEQTALQFSTVSSVSIYINNKPLKTLLSGQ